MISRVPAVCAYEIIRVQCSRFDSSIGVIARPSSTGRTMRDTFLCRLLSDRKQQLSTTYSGSSAAHCNSPSRSFGRFLATKRRLRGRSTRQGARARSPCAVACFQTGRDIWVFNLSVTGNRPATSAAHDGPRGMGSGASLFLRATSRGYFSLI